MLVAQGIAPVLLMLPQLGRGVPNLISPNYPWWLRMGERCGPVAAVSLQGLCNEHDLLGSFFRLARLLL